MNPQMNETLQYIPNCISSSAYIVTVYVNRFFTASLWRSSYLNTPVLSTKSSNQTLSNIYLQLCYEDTSQ